MTNSLGGCCCFLSESGVLAAQCFVSLELLRVVFGTAQNLESMRATGFGHLFACSALFSGLSPPLFLLTVANY